MSTTLSACLPALFFVFFYHRCVWEVSVSPFLPLRRYEPNRADRVSESPNMQG